jgi:hypothetical protein
MENELETQPNIQFDGEDRYSKVIYGYRTLDNKITWRYGTEYISQGEEENIEIRFFLIIRDNPSPQKSDALRMILKYFQKDKVDWLISTRKEWSFNLDAMKNEFEDLNKLSWCKGKVSLEPEFEVKAEKTDISGKRYFETELVFYINPEVLPLNSNMITPPIEIQQSLQRFRLDYPDASKVAFIMMRFGSTKAHDNIVNGIKAALSPHGISAVRADEREYHSDLYYNIMTYLYGCGFGIAVFERIEREDFNPNVSLEVGYLLAMNKPVCLLKDRTLATLHTDLVGKLYRTFDPQEPVETIEPEVSKWMRDKGII